MARNVTVKSMNLGYESAISALLGIDGASVEVGIFSEAGSYPETGIPVAQVAAWNEYGSRRNPARPFMAKTYADKQDQFAETARLVMVSVMTGKTPLDAALTVLGAEQASAVKDTINRWMDPPNSPATVALKGKNDPLVDTRRMRDSVQFKKFQ